MAQGYPNMDASTCKKRQKGNTNEGKSLLTFDTLIRIQQIENYNGTLPMQCNDGSVIALQIKQSPISIFAKSKQVEGIRRCFHCLIQGL